MHLFVAASYSSKVNYETGDVFPDYQEWLESVLSELESYGHSAYCSLREDHYRINDSDPAGAFKVDTAAIAQCEVFLALLDDHVSAGVQTEIGYALALRKKVVLAHARHDKLPYIDDAIIKMGIGRELVLPLTAEAVRAALA